MSLTFKTRLSSNIIDFPYNPDTNSEIEDYLQNLLLKVANTSDNDWQVVFQISPNSIEWLENPKFHAVGIYKKGLNQLIEKKFLRLPFPFLPIKTLIGVYQKSILPFAQKYKQKNFPFIKSIIANLII